MFICCIFECMHFYRQLILLVLATNFYFGQTKPEIITPQLKGSIKFTENLGQWDKSVLFKGSFSNGAVFIQNDGLMLNFLNNNQLHNFHGKNISPDEFKNLKSKGHAIKVKFENAKVPTITKFQMGNDYENFFLDNDKSKWKSNVKNYKQVFLNEIYNGIDYEILADGRGVKYNYRVKPQADPNQIVVNYIGANKIDLDNGVLKIKLAFKEIWEQKPYTYQLINGKVVEVASAYKLQNNRVSFIFPNGYNKNYELIIDPQLVFSAQLGSTSDNFGMTATYDNVGHLYSGGMIYGTNLPASTGAYDNSFNNPGGYGRCDVFISKFSPSGNSLLFSTYLGGSQQEAVTSLILDYSGNLCLYGSTSSPNFPMLNNSAYSLFKGGPTIGFLDNGIIHCGGSDIFVAKINPTGTNLLASTFYGGTHNDGVNYLTGTVSISLGGGSGACQDPFPSTGYDSLVMNYGDQFRGEIQVDNQNNIYITSSTRSSDIPMVGGFDNTINGGQDAVVAKFNTNLSSLIYSSFIGGSQNDCGNSIYVTNVGEAYVSGGTCSSNLLGTQNGVEPSYKGGKSDGFVYRISANGSNIINATYVGTTDYDNSFFVTGDKKGKVYIYGQSYGNIPVQSAITSTAGIFSVPNTHQFIICFTKNLNSYYFSTVFGKKTIPEVDISPTAFAVDVCGNIYLSGWGGGLITNTVAMTGMPTFSAIPGFSTTTGFDFYLMALDSNATNLVFGSYFGGPQSSEHVDGGTSRFDPQGKIYQSVCAGCGTFDDFPITPNTYPCNIPGFCPPGPNISNNCNNGVFKIDFQLKQSVSTINTNTVSGCLPLTISFTNATAPTSTLASFIWYYGNGQTNTTTINPVVTFTNPGTYTVSLVVKDPTSCNLKDSAITFITVYPKPSPSFTLNTSPCSNTISTINGSTGNFSTTPYLWNFGPSTSTLTNPSYTYNTNGAYNVTLTVTDVNGCTNATVAPISIFNFSPGVVAGNTICRGFSANLNASGGTNYTWTPSSTLNNTASATPIANPTTTSIYTVIILNNTPGYNCVKTLTTEVIVNPKPTSAFTATYNPCGGGAYFYDQSSSNVTAWQWSLTAGVTSTVQNPYHFYPVGGTHTVTLISSTQFGCKDTSDLVVNIAVPPVLSINQASIICNGQRAILAASGGTAYAWSPTATLSQTNTATTFATPTISTQYSVVITTADGCAFLLTTNVTVTYPSSIPVLATASPSNIVTGETTTLIFYGDPGALVQWFPQNTTPTTGYTVTAMPDRPTTYTAIASYGKCKEDARVFVDVFLPGCIDKDVFIPNTFTPNGDGQNDILFVRGLKVDVVYFAVYNRWGELVFETNDKTKGWDGIYRSKPADVGVFGWYLKVKCFNGEETFKKGNVTLIR